MYVLEGGLIAWEKAGLPVMREDSARALDRVLAVVDAFGFRHWRRRIASGARGLVMELGAGSGRNARYYPPGVQLVAVEPDLEALRFVRASGRARGAVAVCARAEALPFRDEVFDTSVATLVFCSIDQPDRAAVELARTLKVGGELRGADHVLAPGSLGRLQHLVAPSWYRRTRSCRIDRSSLATFRNAGLTLFPRSRAIGGIFVEYSARKNHRKDGPP
ncbi:MAG: hypothetical protein NVSMB57_07510 [Actinomycetota bacterium]